MSFANTLARPARRFLADRLGQLAQRFEQLVRRLREGIAQVISQTVAEGIHEAVRSALDGRTPQPERYDRERFWNEPEPLRRPDHVDDWRHHEEFGWGSPPAAPPPVAVPAQPAPRWRSALWAGLHASAWWLKSRPGSRPLLSSLGFGGVVGLAALIAGPLGAMLLAAVGSALAFASLAESTREAAGTLG